MWFSLETLNYKLLQVGEEQAYIGFIQFTQTADHHIISYHIM